MKQLLFVWICSFFFLYTVIAEEPVDSDKSLVNVNSEEFKDKVIEQVKARLQKIHSKPMAKFMEDLLQRENVLVDEKNRLEFRAKEIKHNEDSLKIKIKEFQKQQEKLIGCMDDNDKAVKNRASNLVEIISSMRPVSAASVLSVQEPTIAVKIISMLPPAKSAKIFNLMDKEISARLQKQYMNMKR